MKKVAGSVCLFLALCGAPAAAQTTASIFGIVTDETGAVVAGARIQATNTLTNEIAAHHDKRNRQL